MNTAMKELILQKEAMLSYLQKLLRMKDLGRDMHADDTIDNWIKRVSSRLNDITFLINQKKYED